MAEFIPIDWEKVEAYLSYGCSGVEIASQLGINRDTLYDAVKREKNMMFSAYSSIFYEKGNSLLREAQFKKAVIGADNSMLIWLGKQRLDQREHKEEVQKEQKIVFEVNYKNDSNNSISISPPTISTTDTASS